MERKESQSVLFFSTALLSCLILFSAVWFSTVLRQNSVSDPNVLTGNKPGSFHGTTSRKQAPNIKPITLIAALTSEQRRQCYQTCHLELAESLPENLTLPDVLDRPILSTYESWKRLIVSARKRIALAAYKSSLRGKHVLNPEHFQEAYFGDSIFNLLKHAGLERGIRLEAVENFLAKDRGDNEDVAGLYRLGILERRRLDMSRISSSGIMHSKFMIVDDNHFYLGSANFDWRSLNQKMELGVHVENCPCLANDLRILYDSYWAASVEANEEASVDLSTFQNLPALTSKSSPLVIKVGGVDTDVYVAASPKRLSGTKRQWDLDAIVDVIDGAKRRLDIHVMDYVPMYVYEKPRRFWPTIEFAIRRAVIERGVKVRFLTAALHFTSESFAGLKSMLAVNTATPAYGGKVKVKILNVPAMTPGQQTFARERRTHRKFVVTDESLLIGTSNWSGDYFANTTGLAIVMRQNATRVQIEKRKQPLIEQAKQLFERDWYSIYATDLEVYLKHCYDKDTGGDVCKVGRMAYQQASSVSS